MMAAFLFALNDLIIVYLNTSSSAIGDNTHTVNISNAVNRGSEEQTDI